MTKGRREEEKGRREYIHFEQFFIRNLRSMNLEVRKFVACSLLKEGCGLQVALRRDEIGCALVGILECDVATDGAGFVKNEAVVVLSG